MNKRPDSAASPISVVLFTGGAVLDREVVLFLSRLLADPAIEVAGVFSRSPHRGLGGQLSDLWKRRGILAIPLALQLLFRSVWHSVTEPGSTRRREETLRLLRDRIHLVDELHAPEVLAEIRALRPDLGLVYGGPIVKRALFSIPARGTIGIHHGKVPEYRGKKTTFWAMYNGEKDVGVVIQQIGDRLDGGDIIERAIIATGRKPIMVVKKALERQGIEIYLRAIHAIRNGKAQRLPQPTGHSTLYKDPRPADILRFWLRYLRRLCATGR